MLACAASSIGTPAMSMGLSWAGKPRTAMPGRLDQTEPAGRPAAGRRPVPFLQPNRRGCGFHAIRTLAAPSAGRFDPVPLMLPPSQPDSRRMRPGGKKHQLQPNAWPPQARCTLTTRSPRQGQQRGLKPLAPTQLHARRLALDRSPICPALGQPPIAWRADSTD